MRQTERIVMLQVIDNQWKDHLLSMDDLKEGIGNRALRPEGSAGRVQEGILRAVPGHDGPHRRRDGPLPVLPAGHRRASARRAAVPRRGRRRRGGRGSSRSPTSERAAAPGGARPPWRTSRATSSARRKRNWRSCNSSAATARQRRNKQVVKGDKVGRNDPCPCGSGKKYKKCHGQAA